MVLGPEWVKNMLDISKNIFTQSRIWLGHLASKSDKWKEL